MGKLMVVMINQNMKQFILKSINEVEFKIVRIRIHTNYIN